MATPKFAQTAQSFHTELKKRISLYFEEKGAAMTGNLTLYSKAAILLVAFIGVYVHLVFFTPVTWLAVLECVLLGGIVAAIGFNVMHDGAHGSFSKYKWINGLAAFSLNVLGGSSFMWNVKHNVIHHAYTNVDGVDDDIDIQPWMRMSSTQKKYRLHKYQHLYFWFLYSLLYIMWIFVLDYTKYFTSRIGSMPLKKMKLWDHVNFWFFKVLNLFLYVGLPIYMLGFVDWLIGFVIFTTFAGFVLSIVFQLAHTVEHTSFPVPDENSGRLEDEWAIHQLKTTANFATNNKLVCWLVGGLNFQIEHHLFPKISHVHYPAISKIIRKACEEYGIPYIEYAKTRYAIASHVSFLKQMGRA
ncbi:fatty acid desaturase family protein [Flavihumibacter petaseus]|uniref:Linoleoyl-CoA desaturase n=1 Tax=Flavihumibacter petaseus NBRC 106054 TaxID=1220578 RepID=A0A0E9N3M7_9BACT|nr:acyl-CoA desaturase [Flavihumibacter petaseus]GAO44291.1 linoleoyl-CoA desaturase [Flavihumibacter petaseus NBRC 106054]